MRILASIFILVSLMGGVLGCKSTPNPTTMPTNEPKISFIDYKSNALNDLKLAKNELLEAKKSIEVLKNDVIEQNEAYDKAIDNLNKLEDKWYTKVGKFLEKMFWALVGLGILYVILAVLAVLNGWTAIIKMLPAMNVFEFLVKLFRKK